MDAFPEPDQGPLDGHAADDPALHPSNTLAGAPPRGAMEDAALDLVMAASEGDDTVVRQLLRSVVALGLTSSVGYWCQSEPASGSEGWVQVRGFGGQPPAPSEEVSGWTASRLQWPLGEAGVIVAPRETFDRDGQRGDREDAFEALVVLADTLLVGDAHLPGALPSRTKGTNGADRGDGDGAKRAS